MTSTAKKSIDWVTNHGGIATKVEKWRIIPGHPAGGSSFDAFGFADVLAIYPDEDRIELIQATGPSQVVKHMDKFESSIDTLDNIDICLRVSNITIKFHEWRKRKRKNKDGSFSKSQFWIPKIYAVTLDMENAKLHALLVSS